MTDAPAPLDAGAPGAPDPVATPGAGVPWWRRRNPLIALAGLVVLIIVIVVVTSGGSSNGWTPALRAQVLQACEQQANTSAKGCECEINWIVAHLTTAQAAKGTTALGESLAGQILTACPSLTSGS